MRRFRPKTLRWHFVTKSLVVCLLVLTAALAALVQLAATQYAQNNLTRNIELARAIDNIAMVTATPAHIQQFITSSIPDSANVRIRVIDKTSRRIIATNQPNEYMAAEQQIADTEFSKITSKAIASGRFHSFLMTSSGRHFTILPLTSARHTLAGNFVLQQAGVLKASWHKKIKPRYDTWTCWLNGILGLPTEEDFQIYETSPNRFSGVIAIETIRHPTAAITSGTFFSTALLLCIGFLLMALSVWYVCQHYVLSPLNSLSDVLRKQRTGKLDARVERFNVKEFDNVSRQWNSLLNYRQSAEQRQRVLSKVLEQAPIGIEVTNPDARIEYANPAYLEMSGYSLIDVIGKTPKQVLGSRNYDAPKWRQAEATILAGNEWRGEVMSRRKDGGEFYCELTLHPILSDDGDVERVVGVRQDVTARKQYEESLIEAKRKSEAAERANSEFIARMSHEMRTPFNSIIGFADIIANQQLGPVGHPTYLEFATLIEQSAKGLLAIINSIIDLSRMAAGHRPLDETPFSLLSVADSISRSYAEQAEASDLTIKVINELDGCSLKGDERLVHQMLDNLVSNAVKFNKPGGKVDIALKRTAKDQLVIEVRDTGIGIPQEELANAFKPFIQLHPTYNREHEGIGLGLTLAENQAAVHDAKLTVISKVDKGTTARVTFPDYRTIRPKNLTKRKVDENPSNTEAA